VLVPVYERSDSGAELVLYGVASVYGLADKPCDRKNQSLFVHIRSRLVRLRDEKVVPDRGKLLGSPDLSTMLLNYCY
jgi:hypothetical protein